MYFSWVTIFPLFPTKLEESRKMDIGENARKLVKTGAKNALDFFAHAHIMVESNLINKLMICIKLKKNLHQGNPVLIFGEVSLLFEQVFFLGKVSLGLVEKVLLYFVAFFEEVLHFS